MPDPHHLHFKSQLSYFIANTMNHDFDELKGLVATIRAITKRKKTKKKAILGLNMCLSR